MAALLAVFTFAVFVTLDYFVNYRRQKARAGAPVPVPEVASGKAAEIPALEPVWGAGYRMPDSLLYHPAHMWARALSPDTVAIGMDDFARRLIGRADKVALPKPGTWLHQGGKSFRVEAQGRTADLLSPVEGEVIEVNDALHRAPVATEDPYERGWFCKVRGANLAANLRNLLSGSLAQRWMEDAQARLEMKLMALSGSVLQDGGEPAPDFARHLKDEDWTGLVRDFLRT